MHLMEYGATCFSLITVKLGYNGLGYNEHFSEFLHIKLVKNAFKLHFSLKLTLIFFKQEECLLIERLFKQQKYQTHYHY